MDNNFWWNNKTLFDETMKHFSMKQWNNETLFDETMKWWNNETIFDETMKQFGMKHFYHRMRYRR